MTRAAALAIGTPGRLGDERHRARRARVGLDDVEDVLGQGELDVHQAADADALGELARRDADPLELAVAERRGRQRARAVAGVDAGLLDVLHDPAEVHVLAVEEGVDVDLDGVVEEAVDEDRVVGRGLGGLLDVGDERVVVVDDDHAAAAEDVGRAHEDRVADLAGDPSASSELYAVPCFGRDEARPRRAPGRRRHGPRRGGSRSATCRRWAPPRPRGPARDRAASGRRAAR